MQFAQTILNTIGNTPLIKLHRASEVTGCTILGKAEFLNPGQSVKDRAAVFMVQEAYKSGLLREGGTIVEGTAGNTGIGLALVARALGMKCIIVIPETQTQEKKDALLQLGAELVQVPAAPYSNPNNYIHVSERLAKEVNGFWANQFDNQVNRQAHILTTAPEIWRDTDGKIDGFVCAVGSGGTLAGVSMGLKGFNPNIKVALADPHGAALHHFYTQGTLKSEGSSITEGIGQGRITANLQGFTPDESYLISDHEAITQLFDVLEHEGLALGSSSGVNIAGAIRLAQSLGKGKTIVTILCDYGARYASKIYNPAFLKSKNLPVPAWLEQQSTRKAPLV